MPMFILFLLISLFSNSSSAEDVSIRDQIYKMASLTHTPISYKEANLDLFTIIDNHQGIVCSVYSPAECVSTNIVPSPKIMNIEHTWPQSEGARGFAKSDLHHLFPTSSGINSIRSSLPFCDVVVVKWQADQSKRGLNSFGEHCFEPPEGHKGHVARALFYFAIRYGMPIDDHQESYLRLWHHQYPIDQKEIDRNLLIYTFQHNSNPFIDRPELVDLVENF